MPMKVFFCYAHEDETLLNKLKAHLRPLQRQNLIETWYDRTISAGTEWEQAIDRHLNTADIILLLVSPTFMDSDYCYSIEMKRAIERHERGEARVIPIILEYVYWKIDPLNKLQALPADAKPVHSASWHSENEALYNVTEGINKVVQELAANPPSSTVPTATSVQKQELTQPTFVIKSKAFAPVHVLECSTKGLVFSAFSSDGQVLAVDTGELWQPHTGQLLRTLEVETGYFPTFSSDGKFLAISHNGKMGLWQPNTGQLLRTLEVENLDGFFPTFSPNEQLLAAGTSSGEIILWELTTGKILYILEEEDYIDSVWSTFSPDGQFIAAGCSDGKVRLWGMG